MASKSEEGSRNSANLSSLMEQLPRELFWEIIEHTLESVLELRAVSIMRISILLVRIFVLDVISFGHLDVIWMSFGVISNLHFQLFVDISGVERD